MRVCIFCRAPLTSNNRAKEHVLRDSWLRSLGHKKTGIAIDKFSKQSFLRTQELAADQLQAGEVCNRCNSGWMNYLDLRVEHIVLSLARSPGHGVNLCKNDARVVARWLLKTACTFIHADSRERRHISRSILSNVRREGYLPPGFVAFAARSSGPLKELRIAHIDMWNGPKLGNIGTLPQSCRLKFGIQYDNIILGCCYVKCKAPVFSGVSGFHFPLIQSRAKFTLRPTPPGRPDEWFDVPEMVDKNTLNLFLLSVDVEQSE